MIWTAIDSISQYGSLYRSGNWAIHHYTEGSELGFGIHAAKLYKLDSLGREHLVQQFSGKDALERAQQKASEEG